MRARLSLLLVASTLTGCLPDLGRWQVVPSGGADGGVVVGDDAGPGGTPNPIDLGPECPSPHLVVATRVGSGTARILRFDPVSFAECRNAELVEEQRDFGTIIYDVDYHAEVGQLVAVERAILALDGDGFPMWRHQPFQDSRFEPTWVVANGSGASTRIGAFWTESSSLTHGRLIDASGQATSVSFELPFGGFRYAAAHPDRSGRFLLAYPSGRVVQFTISDDTTALRDTDGTDLFDGSDPDFDMLFGRLNHLQADLTLGQLTMAHEDGVLTWAPGQAAPTTARTCTMFCEGFQVATPGPNNDTFAQCDAIGTSGRHLVRLTDGGCDLVIDATSLGSTTLHELVVAHAPL